MVLLYLAVDYPAMGRKRAQRRLLVFPHEAAVAEHVGAEYGGELTFQCPPLMTPIILPRANFVKLDHCPTALITCLNSRIEGTMAYCTICISPPGVEYLGISRYCLGTSSLTITSRPGPAAVKKMVE